MATPRHEFDVQYGNRTKKRNINLFVMYRTSYFASITLLGIKNKYKKFSTLLKKLLTGFSKNLENKLRSRIEDIVNKVLGSSVDQVSTVPDLDKVQSKLLKLQTYLKFFIFIFHFKIISFVYISSLRWYIFKNKSVKLNFI